MRRGWAGWIYHSGQVVCIPKGEFGYGHPDCGSLVHLKLYFTLPITSIAAGWVMQVGRGSWERKGCTSTRCQKSLLSLAPWGRRYGVLPPHPWEVMRCLGTKKGSEFTSLSEPLAVSHRAAGRWQFRPVFSLLGDAHILEGRSECKSGLSCFPHSWIQHFLGWSDKQAQMLLLGSLQGVSSLQWQLTITDCALAGSCSARVTSSLQTAIRFEAELFLEQASLYRL